MNTRRLAILATLLLAACFLRYEPQPAHAYIGGPPATLGMMCSWSTHVIIARVEKVDREKKIVIFKKLHDVKGKWPAEYIKHNFNAGPGERTAIFDWAEIGKTTAIFALESYKWSHTYIDNLWYASHTADWQWWNVSHSEPVLLRTYRGKTDRLVSAVGAIVAGKEVVVPCLVDAPNLDYRAAGFKMQRLWASMRRTDYNPKRDFVDWGSDDFRTVAGMPGFTHLSTLSRVHPEAQAISLTDLDGDGKIDLCLTGSSKIAVLHNGGDYFNETPLPNLSLSGGEAGGCRAAVWADYNGDGKPDLLLAASTGPRLYTNIASGMFRDDTHLLPREEHYTLSAAAWLDYDADGWPDMLLANGYHGLRVYRNLGKAVVAPTFQPTKPTPGKPLPPPPMVWFEDRSDHVGLGSHGPVGQLKGESISVFDVNGDGWPDFFYGAGTGLLFLNTPRGFFLVKDSGITLPAGKTAPVFADFDGDGQPDLFVAHKDQCRLYRGDGTGRFADVTARSGDLARFAGWATSAAWGDVDNDGRLDLVIGCLRGPNRFFRNKGDGAFEDGSDRLGLSQRIFNTQALALVDLNNDGALDMVFNNEGQEPVVLLGAEPAAKRAALTVFPQGASAIGSRIQVFDGKRGLAGAQEISGGAGRGQPAPSTRFCLAPGEYHVEVRFSSGAVVTKEVSLSRTPLRLVVQTD